MSKDIIKTGFVVPFFNSRNIRIVAKSGFVQSVVKQMGGASVATSDVLIESGSYRLLENGGKLILG